MHADAEIGAAPGQVASREGRDDAHARSRRWGRWVALAVVIAVVGTYLAVAVVASARVPAGTQVLGVDLGGLDRTAAVDALAPAAAEVESRDVTLTSGDRSARLAPTDAGLAIDVPGTVEGLLRFSLNPYALMRAFSGAPVDVAPVTMVDEAALAVAVDAVSGPLASGARDAVVEITDSGATVVPGADGIGADVEATAERLATEWPAESVAAVEGPRAPDITTLEAEALAVELNTRVLAGDVLLTGPHGDVTVTADQLVELGSVEAVDGAPVFRVDGARLAAELVTAQPALETEPTGASFRFTASHWLETVESRPGETIDAAALGEAVLAAATSPGRTAELPYIETEPATTSDELGISDFREKVAGFSTPITAEPLRTKNLVRGAEMVTGDVVKPGETYSLIEALSPITAENGYYPAHVIVDGYLSDGIGGGLSQMATTVYNATYFAGLEDVEHRPHSKYFDRYPAGREATLYIGAIDVKFTNNTPYSLVLSAYVTGGRLHVDIWSTPYYTVKTYASERTNIVKATVVESDHEGCLDTPLGADGFTITNTREVYLEGEMVDRESYTWTYRPNDGVTCV